MSSRLGDAPRVAIVLPITLDWQPVVPFDLAADRQRLLALATGVVSGPAVAVEASVADSPAAAAAAGVRALAAGAEAILIVCTMAVLPSVALAAIEELPGRPVVVWALQGETGLSGHTDHAAIVADGGTVGAPMLTSLLTRGGRAFELVLGPPDEATAIEIGHALRAAAAAQRIAQARLGRIGLPTRGYECVDLSEERLHEALGVTVVRIDPAELARLYACVPTSRLREVCDEARSQFAIDPALPGDDLERAARAAAALEQLVGEHELDGGALTCHVEGIRFAPGLGFAPCFALGRMSSHGIPWSCSSDLPAAVAMLALNALGAAAQYHELELLDARTGEFLVASSGEHDLRIAGPGQPQLTRNGWFPDDAHASVCACFAARPGPATLLGFAQIDAPVPTHRLIVAAGAFGARAGAGTGTPHAAYRFAGSSPTGSWKRWCYAGASLHTACTLGDLTGLVESLGRQLGTEVVSIREG